MADALAPLGERKPSIPTSAIRPRGLFPVVDQSVNFISGYTDDLSAVYRDALPLIVFGDHSRTVKFVDFEFATGADGTKLLKPDGRFDPQFFYFALRAIEVPNRGYNRHYRILAQSEFRYPIKQTTQRAIAAVLSKLDAAIRVQSRMRDTLVALKDSTMTRVFREGIGREPLRTTEIGLIPQSWSMKTLGEFVTLQRGIDLPVHTRRSGTVPVIGSNGVVGHHDEVAVKGPGVIVGRSGSVGKAHFINCDFWPLNTALYVRDFHGNDPSFAYYFLDFLELGRFASGVSVPTLNRNVVHQERVPVPGLSEQVEIAKVLGGMDGAIRAATSKAEACQELFDVTLGKLMTGELSAETSQGAGA